MAYILNTIKTIRDSNYNSVDTPFDIQGENQQECLDKFFRLNNSLKYCNGYGYSLIHKADKDAYKEWFTIGNYARCGGDMW
jgi:hypothetical protein